MLASRFAQSLRRPFLVRQFRCTAVKHDKPAPQPSQSQNQNKKTQELLGGEMYRVTPFDRWMLVWVKRYKSKEEVPDQVTQECILTSRSKARIKTCNYMIGITIISFLYAIYSGKRDAAAGKTWTKLGEERHKKIQEEAAMERATAMAAAKSSAN